MAKTMTRTTDVPADQAPAAPAAPAADQETGEVKPAKEKKERKPRTPPTYRNQVVTGFPEEVLPESHGRGRESVYLPLLQDVVDNNPGEIVWLTEFPTPGSAGEAVKAFEEGKRPIPEGTSLDQWEFKAVRSVWNDDNGNPVLDEKGKQKIKSDLYVRYTPR